VSPSAALVPPDQGSERFTRNLGTPHADLVADATLHTRERRPSVPQVMERIPKDKQTLLALALARAKALGEKVKPENEPKPRTPRRARSRNRPEG